MANCLLLSGLSMERIDGDEERLDEETFVCETNLQAEEGRYRGEERGVRWKGKSDDMVPEVTMTNDRRISRVGSKLGLRRSWNSVACVAIPYRCARLPRWSLIAGTVSKIEAVVFRAAKFWLQGNKRQEKPKCERTVSRMWAKDRPG